MTKTSGSREIIQYVLGTLNLHVPMPKSVSDSTGVRAAWLSRARA